MTTHETRMSRVLSAFTSGRLLVDARTQSLDGLDDILAVYDPACATPHGGRMCANRTKVDPSVLAPWIAYVTDTVASVTAPGFRSEFLTASWLDVLTHLGDSNRVAAIEWRVRAALVRLNPHTKFIRGDSTGQSLTDPIAELCDRRAAGENIDDATWDAAIDVVRVYCASTAWASDGFLRLAEAARCEDFGALVRAASFGPCWNKEIEMDRESRRRGFREGSHGSYPEDWAMARVLERVVLTCRNQVLGGPGEHWGDRCEAPTIVVAPGPVGHDVRREACLRAAT